MLKLIREAKKTQLTGLELANLKVLEKIKVKGGNTNYFKSAN